MLRGPMSRDSTAEAFPSDAFLCGSRARLRRVLARYSIPYQDAEDLLQEALLAAVLCWDTIENPESWLAGTLAHKCQMYWRTRRRSRVEAVDGDTLELLAPPLQAPQEQSDSASDLYRLLAELEEPHREMFHLRYVDGMTSVELSKQLGIPCASVRKLTCRSFGKLQKKLSAAGGA